MEIRLNLATRPLENTRRFVALSGIAGVALLALFVFLSTESVRIWKENREMREEMGRLQNDMADFRSQRRELEDVFKHDDTKRVMDRAAFLNGLIEQRSFPWTRIFMDLERLLPSGARIISLAPKREEGRVELRMIVGAQNDESKVKFLKALEEAAEFERIVVNSERRKEAGQSGGGEDAITLELDARYRTQGPAPAKPAAPAQKGAM